MAEAKRQAVRLGVTPLDGNAVELAGVRFLGGTLWADGRLSGIDATPDQATGDRIDVAHAGGARRITVGDAIGLHRKTRRVLDRLLAAPRDRRKVVVVTHHAPHPLCLPPGAPSPWRQALRRRIWRG